MGGPGFEEKKAPAAKLAAEAKKIGEKSVPTMPAVAASAATGAVSGLVSAGLSGIGAGVGAGTGAAMQALFGGMYGGAAGHGTVAGAQGAAGKKSDKAKPTGLAGYQVIPDDFVGPPTSNQIRKSEYDELQKYGFDKFQVVGDDFKGKLANNQMNQDQYAQLQRAWLHMMHGQGVKLQGSDADQGAFKNMLAGGLGNSPQFRSLVSSLGNDSENTLTMDLGRSQPGLMVDAFEYEASSGSRHKRNVQTIDLDDYEKIPGAPPRDAPDAQTRTQKLIHALTEAQSGMKSSETDGGKRYLPAHSSAIDAENDYRAEQGQNGKRRYEDPEGTADGGWTYDYGEHKEQWDWNGTNLKEIKYSK